MLVVARLVTTDLWLGCCASRRLAMTSGLKAAALLWFLDNIAAEAPEAVGFLAVWDGGGG